MFNFETDLVLINFVTFYGEINIKLIILLVQIHMVKLGVQLWNPLRVNKVKLYLNNNFKWILRTLSYDG